MTDGDDHHDHSESLPPGNFLIYTLADQPLVSPGAKVKYADRLRNVDEPLDSYDPAGKFLVRQRIKFNAHRVEDDLYFKEAEPFHVGRADAVTVNPDDTDTANGMMAFEATPKQVALTASPSVVQEANFRRTRFITGIRSFIGDLAELSVFIPLLQEVVDEAPYLLLLLVHPIVYGALWVRRKALKYVFGGIYMGAVGATGLLTVYELLTVTYTTFEVFAYTGYAAVVGLLPATVAAACAFLASMAARHLKTLEQVQQQMTNAGWKTAVGAIALPPVLTAGYYLTMAETRIGTQLPPLLLPTLFFTAVSGAGAYLLYRRHRHDEAQELETRSWDWAWFVVALVAALIALIVIGATLEATNRSRLLSAPSLTALQRFRYYATANREEKWP
jgi:hypothetical protein